METLIRAWAAEFGPHGVRVSLTLRDGTDSSGAVIAVIDAAAAASFAFDAVRILAAIAPAFSFRVNKNMPLVLRESVE